MNTIYFQTTWTLENCTLENSRYQAGKNKQLLLKCIDGNNIIKMLALDRCGKLSLRINLILNQMNESTFGKDGVIGTRCTLLHETTKNKPEAVI